MIPLFEIRINLILARTAITTYSGTILRSLEPVQFGLSRCNGTFRDAIDTIHLIRSELPHAVPVDTRSVDSQMVRHSDFHSVAPICN
jgi:hypothetical protein